MRLNVLYVHFLLKKEINTVFNLAPVVQNVDNSIYPVDRVSLTTERDKTAIHRVVIDCIKSR